jgi:hypothetical protein
MLTLRMAATALLLAATACRAGEGAPNPAVTYRLADGGCIRFSALPRGWAPSAQTKPDLEARFEGQVGAVRVKASLLTDGSHADEYGRSVIGWRRLGQYDVDGLAAWAADDGEMVFADGDRQSARVVVECVPELRRPVTAATCHIHDRRSASGRVLNIDIPLTPANLAKAMSVTNAVEQVASHLPVPCA